MNCMKYGRGAAMAGHHCDVFTLYTWSWEAELLRIFHVAQLMKMKKY